MPVRGWFRASRLVRGKVVEELANTTFTLGMVTFGKKGDAAMARKKKEVLGGQPVQGSSQGSVQKELPLTPAAAAPATNPAPAPTPVDITKQGLVSFKIGEKLAGVFGEYTSLEMEIGLMVPGDPSHFEAVIDKFLPRVVLKIQGTMNQIAVGSGFKSVWGDAAPR